MKLIDTIKSAYEKECEAVRLYNALIELCDGLDEAGETIDTFREIVSVRLRGIELLENLSVEQNCHLQAQDNNDDKNEPLKDIGLNKDGAKLSLKQIIKKALEFEDEINALYNDICESLDNDDERDLFFRLWATSNNEYIPALKHIYKGQKQNLDQMKQTSILSNLLKNVTGVNQEQMSEFMGEAEKLIGKKPSKDEISKLINHPSFSFFSGLALGGIAAMMTVELVKEMMEDNYE